MCPCAPPMLDRRFLVSEASRVEALGNSVGSTQSSIASVVSWFLIILVGSNARPFSPKGCFDLWQFGRVLRLDLPPRRAVAFPWYTVLHTTMNTCFTCWIVDRGWWNYGIIIVGRACFDRSIPPAPYTPPSLRPPFSLYNVLLYRYSY